MERSPQELLLHGGVGYDDDIILIAAPGVVPLCLEHSDHLKRQVLDPDGLSNRIAAGKQFRPNGVAQHGHPGGCLDVTIVEEAALGNGPVSHFWIQLVISLDPGIPVLVSKHHLGHRPGAGTDRLDRRALAQHGLEVGGFQSVHRSGGTPDPPGTATARPHPNGVVAQAGDFFLNLALRTLAETHHGNHCCYADDDSQHGQSRANFVPAQGLERYFQDHPVVHFSTPVMDCVPPGPTPCERAVRSSRPSGSDRPSCVFVVMRSRRSPVRE